jgi:MYXO-CTERM domain-containing protein
MTGTPVNDAPTATNLSAAETYTEDTAVNLTDIVVADIDGGNLTVTLTLSNSAAGTLSTGTSGAVTSTFSGGVWTATGAIANVNTLLAGVMFVPATNFNANFAINTSVSDGVAAALTGSKAMTGTPVNDAPTAVDDAVTVAEGGQTSIPVAANDTDPDDSLNLGTVAIGTMPQHGTVTVNSDGTVTYQHDSSDTTSDSFTYTIKDGADAVSNVATVAITVTPVADDGDADGVPDSSDNCPAVANSNQTDSDNDGIGDKCDPTPGGPDSGCGCSSSHGSPAGAWPLALALIALGRRRRRGKRA